MSQQELQELIRLVSAGRRDAADKLAELLHPVLFPAVGQDVAPAPVEATPRVAKRKGAPE